MTAQAAATAPGGLVPVMLGVAYPPLGHSLNSYGWYWYRSSFRHAMADVPRAA